MKRKIPRLYPVLQRKPLVDVVIPAYNVQDYIGFLVSEIPREIVRDVIVVDNDSSDLTSYEANKAGATVLSESRAGLGYAFMTGVRFMGDKIKSPDIAIILTGDERYPCGKISELINSITGQRIDMVTGSRFLDQSFKKSMSRSEFFINRMTLKAMKRFFNSSFSDTAPIAAFWFEKLKNLTIDGKNPNWFIELQIKALKSGFRFAEVPVSYLKKPHKKLTPAHLRSSIRKVIWLIRTFNRNR
jgi:glycosyltransferase involved in cell wall biosynthesis